MGMSAFYGAHDDAESLRTLNHALDRGVNLLDTADMYGPYRNEELLAQLLKSRRSEVVLATKFGIVMDSASPAARGVNGRPEYVRSSCEGSLKRLGVDVIDLYYQHRVDPEVPIEDTVGAMAELVRAGKVRLSGPVEAAPDTLRRAHWYPFMRCKASIPCGHETRSSRRWSCAWSWVSVSSLTARWGVVS